MNIQHSHLLSQTSPVLEPYQLPPEVSQGQQEASRLWEHLMPIHQDRGEEIMQQTGRTLLPASELI